MNILFASAIAVALGIMWSRLLTPRFTWGAFCAGLLITAGFAYQAYISQDEGVWVISGLAAVMGLAQQLATAHYLAESEAFSELPYTDRLRIAFMSETKKAHLEAILLKSQISDTPAAVDAQR